MTLSRLSPRPLLACARLFLLAFIMMLGIAHATSDGSTIPAAKAASDTFRGNGWWWAGASQSGTGFFVEAQADRSFIAFFMYDDAGNATWYTSAGNLTATGGDTFSYTGNLFTCRGGQAASSNTASAPVCVAAGNLSITFSSPTAATVRLPARTFAAERFNFNGLGSTPSGNQPETGWYWNPAQDGRGYGIEVQNGIMFFVMFHYRTDGTATWNTYSGPVGTDGRFSGNFISVTGGQTLAGAYRAPNPATFTPGFLGQYSSPCNASFTFPGNSTPSSVNRFGFGVTDTQACKSSQGGASGIVFKTESAVAGQAAALQTLNQQGAQGFAWISGLAVQTGISGGLPQFAFADLYAKAEPGVTYQYVADAAVSDPSQFLAQLNGRGAEGYVFKGQYAFNPSTSPTTQFYYVFVKSTRRATTYSYRLLQQPSASTLNLTELNQQGREGYAYRGPLLFGTQAVSLYVKDNTNGATYAYETTPALSSAAAALAEMNARGAQFFALRGTFFTGGTTLALYERASTTTSAIQYATAPSQPNEPFAALVAKANDFAARGLIYWSDFVFNNGSEYVSLFYKGPPVSHPLYGVVFP